MEWALTLFRSFGSVFRGCLLDISSSGHFTCCGGQVIRFICGYWLFCCRWAWCRRLCWLKYLKRRISTRRMAATVLGDTDIDMKKVLLLVEVIVCILPLFILWIPGAFFTALYFYLSITKDRSLTGTSFDIIIPTIFGFLGIIGLLNAMYSILMDTAPVKRKCLTTLVFMCCGVFSVNYIVFSARDIGPLIIFSLIPTLSSAHVGIRYFQLMKKPFNNTLKWVTPKKTAYTGLP